MLYDYVCVEGNIGSGKTLLASMLADIFDAKLILERFSNNPFLPKFYKNPTKYAFPLELFFMVERYKQIKHFKEQEIFSDFTVSDYFFIKSRLFAQNNLPAEELQLFYNIFDIMLSALPKPNLLIYLHADIQFLQKNIKKRDRSYEQDITDDYLLRIQKRYLDFFKKQNDFPVLIIDITNTDFVENDSVYQKIVSAIKKPYSFGVYQLSLQ